ncbi:Regulator of telomere elongation helicase 1-like protein, partial [Armadillidium nasatum]
SVVLGSRNHTCIHPVVSKSKSKNEGCKTLLDGKDGEFCSFFHGANRMKTHEQLYNLGYPSVCDLEDMVKIGKKLKACPYYASRHLMETAQIIICPYNYLIDPLIRESMCIDLRKNILVLDEAHNVEDSCRGSCFLLP